MQFRPGAATSGGSYSDTQNTTPALPAVSIPWRVYLTVFGPTAVGAVFLGRAAAGELLVAA